MFGLGWSELVLIAAAALLVFGPKKLPEVAKGLGKGIRDFKKALSGEDEEQSGAKKSATGETPPAQAPTGTVAQGKKDPAKTGEPG